MLHDIKSQILPLLHYLPRSTEITPQPCRANMQIQDRPGQITSLILATALKTFQVVPLGSGAVALRGASSRALEPTALTHSHAPAFDSATNRRPLASYRGEEHGIFTYIFVHTYMCVSICISIYLHIYVYIYIYLCITRCR